LAGTVTRSRAPTIAAVEAMSWWGAGTRRQWITSDLIFLPAVHALGEVLHQLGQVAKLEVHALKHAASPQVASGSCRGATGRGTHKLIGFNREGFCLIVVRK
jgi:hypothetical protein